MPIDRETFEGRSNFQDPETYPEQIVRFLAENADKAFTRDEIVNGTGIDPYNASTVLKVLEEHEVVRNKPPYWAIRKSNQTKSSIKIAREINLPDEQIGAGELKSQGTYRTE